MRKPALMLVVSFAIAATAAAVEPTGSSFPGALDDFQPVLKLDTWTAVHHNRLLDAVNEMQQVMFTNGLEETACADFSVQPAQRKLINVTVSQALAGDEPVFGAVRDDDSPARVAFDDVEQLVGTIAQVWVFNRDAQNARTGSVCVQVVRGMP